MTCIDLLQTPQRSFDLKGCVKVQISTLLYSKSQAISHKETEEITKTLSGQMLCKTILTCKKRSVSSPCEKLQNS